MNARRVTEIDDPRLCPFRQLTRARDSRRDGWFIAEGAELARRLLASRCEVESLLFDEARWERWDEPIDPAIEVLVAPTALVRSLVGFPFHRGVLARGRRPMGPELSDWLRRAPRQALAVVCPDAQDAENLGSLMRTAWAFGVDLVLLSRRGVDPFSRRVVRVSMGGVCYLPIHEADDPLAAAERLRTEGGFRLLATTPHSQVPSLSQVADAPRVAAVFGGESHGLGPEWLARCDEQARIVIDSHVDSLNVAVAAGIVLNRLRNG